jgi:hypothetical protein
MPNNKNTEKLLQLLSVIMFIWERYEAQIQLTEHKIQHQFIMKLLIYRMAT